MTEATQQTSSGNTAVRAFQAGFPEAELTELRRRINATRWPEHVLRCLARAGPRKIRPPGENCGRWQSLKGTRNGL